MAVVSGERRQVDEQLQEVRKLVYATHGDDVTTTIVNGRVLMRDRKVLTLDESAVLAEARALADTVRAAVR